MKTPFLYSGQYPLEPFLADLAFIPWLQHTHEPMPDAIVVPGFAEAFDDWSDTVMQVWAPRTHRLETYAQHHIGDAAITTLFSIVSDTIQTPLYQSIGAYFLQREAFDSHFDADGMQAGLTGEVMEAIKRDIAWAAIEYVTGQTDFFCSSPCMVSSWPLAMWMEWCLS